MSLHRPGFSKSDTFSLYAPKREEESRAVAVEPPAPGALGLDDLDKLRATIDAIEPQRPSAPRRRNRLNEIAELVRSLTYGEMIELAEAIWNIHDSEGQSDEITKASLPGILHKWSMGR